MRLQDWNDPIAMLGRYSEAIRALPPDVLSADRLFRDFTLFEEGDVRICFAPMGGMVPTAKVVVVGITPGLSETQIAFASARRCLLAGESPTNALAAAEKECSFAGVMRANLCRMLDELGVASHLGITSTTAFFTHGSGGSVCNATSAIRYPVFVRGKNFTGHTPDMLKTAVLRSTLETVLGTELATFANALIVPCGDSVTRAIGHLKEMGLLQNQFVLEGFPHASGANGHRKRQFAERQDSIRATVKRWAETQGAIEGNATLELERSGHLGPCVQRAGPIHRPPVA